MRRAPQRHDHEELVELFLEHGATVFAAADHDPDRPSAMHLAAEHANVDICRSLLARGGADALAYFDYVHRTPLIVAVVRCSLPHVELFLGAGAEATLADDENHGDPPLRHAIKPGTSRS